MTRLIKAKTWTERTRPLAYAHAKRDGIWLEVEKDRLGVVTARTSHPTDITRRLDACGFMGTVYERLPVDTKVIGELYVPGRSRSQVKHCLADDPRRLRWAGFAIASERPSLELHAVNLKLTLWGIETIQYRVHEAVEPPEYLIGEVTYNSPVELLRDVPQDHEGWVLKDGNLDSWYKLKREHEIDLVVTGVKDGRGKYLGLVGALVLSTTEGFEVARVGGMTDAERVWMSEHEDELVGRVCEVRYQYVGDRGRLTHPRFLRWRDDKTASECLADQDPDLEDHWSTR